MVKFSFIIPVYGQFNDNNLEYCIKFLVNQTFKDYEIIICGNKVLENSIYYLNNIKITNLIIDTNRLGKLMNESIKIATGEFIHIWQMDLITYPDYIEKLIDYINKYDDTYLYAGKLIMMNTIDTRKNFIDFYFNSYDKPEGMCCIHKRYFQPFREEFEGSATHWCQEWLLRIWKKMNKKFICMQDVEVVHLPHNQRMSYEQSLIDSQKSSQLFEVMKNES